jgi:hypothetical protein
LGHHGPSSGQVVETYLGHHGVSSGQVVLTLGLGFLLALMLLLLKQPNTLMKKSPHNAP